MAPDAVWRDHSTPGIHIELRSTRSPSEAAPGAPLRRLVTSEPAFVVSSGMHVTMWNRALELLTGMSSNDAVGRRCDTVVASICHGSPPSCCRPACPLIGPALRGWPAERVACSIETPAGPVRAGLATIGGGAGTELMHLVESESASHHPEADRR